MVRFVFYIVLFSLLTFTLESFAQTAQIDTRKEELNKLKDEISRLENELSQKNKKEKKTLEDLDNISKQNFLVNKLLTTLRSEEAQKEIEINKSVSNIASIEKEIDQLQKNYAKYVTATYKNGTHTEMETILDANSFQQAVVRLEYLKRFSVSREKDLVKLEENKTKLIKAKEKLIIEKKEKQELTKQKEVEEKSLSQKLKSQKSILAEIKKDKKKIAKSVSDKRKSEQKIRDLIVKMVEEAEAKRKREEEALRLKKTETVVSKETKTKKEVEQGDYDINLSTSKFSSFSELRGKLNWPISKGKVVRKFGESLNPKLKTLTVNYGIDIKAGGDMSVKCVAEGVVSAVEWLPGYGTVLIVSHKGDYRTVYGHLSEVFVKEGDKLKTGGVIAKVGESVEGNILHFEVWSGRQNVNPELWLRN
ncbi:MAG: peptidoglycan DD-metalloendopeptidase family protein [Ignavibacteriaceae bacterium]|nr:peptidoglycan DD-metalloendopeptidase family protein [Ignavibacterium sp.]MCC6255107.1 peptidoglycan DD-metalloendopeptidase family protein [Ignavibacteriaceae bacterium]HRN27579.1 peptidoglycan DD-metalloendopeptidase family protein [Ignavibacteriaceae bacterium]HRQ55485.1 peptidoglycan DD-metalloendopeptidase family protein [Ignavibacteriaceae bacterium]